MKNGKRLTLEEKKFLKDQGLDPKYILRTKKTAEFYEFVETTSGKVFTVWR